MVVFVVDNEGTDEQSEIDDKLRTVCSHKRRRHAVSCSNRHCSVESCSLQRFVEWVLEMLITWREMRRIRYASSAIQDHRQVCRQSDQWRSITLRTGEPSS